MSIQDFIESGGKPEEVTFEALNQRVKQLLAQIERMIAIKDELSMPSKPFSIKNYDALVRNVDQQQSKLDAYIIDLNSLSNESHPLKQGITDDINEARGHLSKLHEAIIVLKERRDNTFIDETEKLNKENENRNKLAMQIEAENNYKEAVALEQAAGEIVEQMTVLKDTTDLLNSYLDEQHEKIQGIEKITEEAHEEMVAGNAELETATEHQKSGSKCLYFIVGGVAAIVIIVIIIILFATGVF